MHEVANIEKVSRMMGTNVEPEAVETGEGCRRGIAILPLARSMEDRTFLFL